MNNMPTELRNELAKDKYYKRCSIEDANCKGRITWEHAMEFRGSQVQERWAIIPLCWRHHLGDLLNKEKNHWIALSRATEEDLDKYPRAKDRWIQELKYLNTKYGKEK